MKKIKILKQENILILIIGINFFLTNIAHTQDSNFHDFKISDVEKKLTSSYRVKALVDRYKTDWVIDEMRKFIENSHPTRLAGTKTHEKISDYLIKRIKELDASNSGKVWREEFIPNFEYAISKYEENFKNQIEKNFDSKNSQYIEWRAKTDSINEYLNELKKNKILTGHNILWEKKGIVSPNEMIIIGAYFDSIAFDEKTFKLDKNLNAPGADDNATGVSALLSMIKTFSNLDLPKTIRIVFFDFGQLGNLGSHAYTAKHKDFLTGVNKPYAFVNLLMLGHDSKRSDRLKKEGNMKLYVWEKNNIVGNKLINWGDKMHAPVQFEVYSPAPLNTDAQNFEKLGVQTVIFSQNWEDDFNSERNHTANDFVETINRKTFMASFRFIMGAVLSWSYEL